MNCLAAWLDANKLHLNTSKMKILLVGKLKNHKFNVEFNRSAIGRVGSKEDQKTYKYHERLQHHSILESFSIVLKGAQLCI
jgi:hypothetical protein